MIQQLNPANLDRAKLGELIKQYGGEKMYSRWPEFEAQMISGMGSALPEDVRQRATHATDHLGFKLWPAAVHLFSAILLDEFAELGAIKIGRVEFLDHIAVAFLPMGDEISKHTASPRNTTFEKRETAYAENDE